MSYGFITTVDAGVMESVLVLFTGKPIRVLEVGTYTGGTARGIRDFCAAQNSDLEYWGVDASPFSAPAPFPGAHYIVGKSEEVADQVPDELDVAFIDACHCVNHVILDALHYGRKVKVGGFIIFHDSAPDVQHVQHNDWVHGDEDRPIWKTGVLDAFGLLGWPNDAWEIFKQDYDPTALLGGLRYGGMTAFRRIK